ncbi:MAG TPA: sulfotransferase [Steroidobacteraceae bacterium]|nr:sulfotransferase [Steroidobacteraceae bacterium]
MSDSIETPRPPAEALARAEEALARAPTDARLLLARAQCLLVLGRLPEAGTAAAAVERHAPADPVLWDALGTLFSRANDQRGALRAYDEAVRLAPREPQFLFNRAAVRRFLGALEDAEADYDRALALNPTDYEAYRNRADLRTQTAARNHVAELERALAAGRPDWHGEVQLRYALAKELEDLGEHERSFAHLARGARLRREHMRYDPVGDLATVDWIIEAFPDAGPGPAADASEESPIFIVGLPRSGSTLLERILDSHSAVTAAGELPCFAHAVVDAVRRDGGPAPRSRRELIARSARLDFAALGRDYLARARAAGATGARFTDKMPLNHLYCALIERALPRARIVHVRRAPMAACYAIYKSLFEDGYPYSYDLTELARYYVAYERLMRHWASLFPGAIHEVRYERLVADQVTETQRLLQFCGLPWEDACVEFHRNPAASTTASAAQVRRPLYRTALEQWRRYERQLAPVQRILAEAGITDAG